MKPGAQCTRYFGGREQNYIRVRRPQKPPSNEFQLLFSNSRAKIPGGAVENRRPGAPEDVGDIIFVFSNPENPREKVTTIIFKV